LTPSFEKNPSPTPVKARNVVTKNYGSLAAHSEDFVILACTVLIQITSVTDKQTDGQTLRRWLRRAKHFAVARKNHY